MTTDIYVLDGNLQTIGIIDSYKSLIWAERYSDIGDCEIYLPASTESLNLLSMGRYLFRSATNMVCRIDKIELTTDNEEGNYLIISGIDTKALCDQRVVTKTMFCDGAVEVFMRKMITDTMIAPTNSSRKMKKDNGGVLVGLGTLAGLTEALTAQVTWDNVGERIRAYCETYGLGYRFLLSSGLLNAEFYKGTDRHNSVIFSNEYENLASTDYTDDKTNMGNVAVVGGEGQGSERTVTTYGTAEGIERYEIFVDSDSLSRSVTYSDLIEAYPDGTVYYNGNNYYYRLATLDAPTFDAKHLAWLQTNYPGGSLVTVNGETYWRISNVSIAKVESGTPEGSSTATLLNIIYLANLLSSGQEATKEFGEVKTFEGSIIPDVTFVYGTDYKLGDIVTVKNEYGITSEARITEIVEVFDENGYSFEPSFKYMEVV